jgi:hypothetical protein
VGREGGQAVSDELLNKLLEYIDAAIDEKSEDARQSDGGLIERLRKLRVRDELFDMVNKEAK